VAVRRFSGGSGVVAPFGSFVRRSADPRGDDFVPFDS